MRLTKTLNIKLAKILYPQETEAAKFYDYCCNVVGAKRASDDYKELQLKSDPNKESRALRLYKWLKGDYDENDFEPTLDTVEQSISEWRKARDEFIVREYARVRTGLFDVHDSTPVRPIPASNNEEMQGQIKKLSETMNLVLQQLQ